MIQTDMILEFLRLRQLRYWLYVRLNADFARPHTPSRKSYSQQSAVDINVLSQRLVIKDNWKVKGEVAELGKLCSSLHSNHHLTNTQLWRQVKVLLLSIAEQSASWSRKWRGLTPPPEVHFDGRAEARTRGTGFMYFN